MSASDPCSPERLAAYIAADITIRTLAVGGQYYGLTFGEVVDETLRLVDVSLSAGTLGLDILSFERDPEDR